MIRTLGYHSFQSLYFSLFCIVVIHLYNTFTERLVGTKHWLVAAGIISEKDIQQWTQVTQTKIFSNKIIIDCDNYKHNAITTNREQEGYFS